MKQRWRYHRLFGAALLLMGALGCGQDYHVDDLACPAGSISQVISSTGADVGVGKTSLGGRAIAQSITPSTTIQVTKVKLLLKSVGIPSGSVDLIFANDSSGSPGTYVGDTLSSVTISSTNITSSGRYVTFTFSNAPTLTAGTKYWLKLSASYTASDTNYVSWMGADGDPHSDGNAIYETSTPGTWSNASIGTGRDLAFIIGC